jgi:glutamate-1-semialdehyde aminotransferase
MPQVLVEMSAEELKGLIFQLPTEEFLKLVEEIEERAETIAMMRLSETGFQEWNQPGEEIYA